MQMNLPPPPNPNSRLRQIARACCGLITWYVKYVALAVLAAVASYAGFLVVKPMWKCLLLVLKAVGEV